MKAHDYAVIFSIVAITLCLALAGCHRQPPALAATPPPVVTVSLPLEREVTDPLAACLLHGILAELEAGLKLKRANACAGRPSATQPAAATPQAEIA